MISADVDVMRENANNSVGELFTSTGFRAGLFDDIGDNQARHFMGGLIAGYNLGATAGALVMNHNENSQADLRVTNQHTSWRVSQTKSREDSQAIGREMILGTGQTWNPASKHLLMRFAIKFVLDEVASTEGFSYG